MSDTAIEVAQAWCEEEISTADLEQWLAEHMDQAEEPLVQSMWACARLARQKGREAGEVVARQELQWELWNDEDNWEPVA